AAFFRRPATPYQGFYFASCVTGLRGVPVAAVSACRGRMGVSASWPVVRVVSDGPLYFMILSSQVLARQGCELPLIATIGSSHQDHETRTHLPQGARRYQLLAMAGGVTERPTCC